MKKLGEIIKQGRKAKRLSQTAFGDLVGYDQRTVSDWEHGKSAQFRNPDKIADVIGVSREEFTAAIQRAIEENPEIKRISPKFRPVNTTTTSPLDVAATSHQSSGAKLLVETSQIYGHRDVPVYGRAQGGGEGAFEFNGDIMGWEMRPPVLEGVRNAYAVYVDGSSMYPRYKAGETVWVNPNRPPKREDDVIVQVHPNDPSDPPLGFIKEFVGWSGNSLVVRQHNPSGEMVIPKERVISIHLIVFSQRSG